MTLRGLGASPPSSLFYSMNLINWYDAGFCDYDSALFFQQRLHAGVACGDLHDSVLFQENQPVITLGRDAKQSSLLWSAQRIADAGIILRQVERGGDATYHGPGILVISPILRFLDYASNVHLYLRMLEETVIRQCAAYGLHGFRKNGKSGVWLDDGKLSAVGVAVSRSATMHGLSLNVNPEWTHFSAIVPCGLVGEGVTSLATHGVYKTVKHARDDFLAALSEVFGAKLLPGTPVTQEKE